MRNQISGCPLRSPRCGGPIRNSHIIQEFLFKYAYDDFHRILKVDASARSPKFLQKGMRAPLLCDGCEHFLNDAYEATAAKSWDDWIPATADAPMLRFPREASELLKLLHLSILWRASVADHEMFEAEGPIDELLAILVSPSPKSRELRQNSPFAGLLSETERAKLLEA